MTTRRTDAAADRSFGVVSKEETVLIVRESRVYHLDPRCPALNRSNRYWPINEVPRSKGTKGRSVCRLCWTPQMRDSTSSGREP